MKNNPIILLCSVLVCLLGPTPTHAQECPQCPTPSIEYMPGIYDGYAYIQNTGWVQSTDTNNPSPRINISAVKRKVMATNEETIDLDVDSTPGLQAEVDYLNPDAGLLAAEFCMVPPMLIQPGDSISDNNFAGGYFYVKDDLAEQTPATLTARYNQIKALYPSDTASEGTNSSGYLAYSDTGTQDHGDQTAHYKLDMEIGPDHLYVNVFHTNVLTTNADVVVGYMKVVTSWQIAAGQKSFAEVDTYSIYGTAVFDSDTSERVRFKGEVTQRIQGVATPSYYRLHCLVPPGEQVTLNWNERPTRTWEPVMAGGQEMAPTNDHAPWPAPLAVNCSWASPDDGDGSQYTPHEAGSQYDPLFCFGDIPNANLHNGSVLSQHDQSAMALIGGNFAAASQSTSTPGAGSLSDSGYVFDTAYAGLNDPRRHMMGSKPVQDAKRALRLAGNGLVQHSPWYWVNMQPLNGAGPTAFTIGVPLLKNSTCHKCKPGTSKATPDLFSIDSGVSTTGDSGGKFELYPKQVLAIGADQFYVDTYCYLSPWIKDLWGGVHPGCGLQAQRGVQIAGNLSPWSDIYSLHEVDGPTPQGSRSFDSARTHGTVDGTADHTVVTQRHNATGETTTWDIVCTTNYTDSGAFEKDITITKTSSSPDVPPETTTYTYVNGSYPQYTVTAPEQTILTTLLFDGERITTMDPQGNLSEVVDYHYDNPYSAHRVLTSKVVDPDHAALTTTYSYYDVLDYDSQPRLKQVVDPQGGWVRYEYNGPGDQPTREIHGIGNAAAPDPDANDASIYTNLVTDYVLSDFYPGLPVTNQVSFGNKVVSTSYAPAAPSQANFIKCPTPGAKQGASDNLTNELTFCTEGIAWTLGKPRRIERPDGTRQVHFYEFPTTSTVVETILDGQPDPSSPVNVIKGTRTVLVQRPTGEELSRTVYDLPSEAILSQDIGSNFDSLDRPQLLAHLDGSFETIQYSCCGIGTITRSDGTSTSYNYDGRKRVTAETHTLGNNTETLSYTYDASDHVLTISRAWNNEAFSLLKSYGYDLAGRLTNITDVLLGLTNTVAYSSDNRTVTLTAPTGATKVLQYNLDGTLDSVSGTGAKPFSATVAVESVAGVNRLVLQEFASTDKDTAKYWKKTYLDGMLRPIQTVRPVDTATFATDLFNYNAKGQLVTTVDADNVKTVQTYDSLGAPEFQSIKDATSSDAIETAGNTPLRKLEHSVIPSDSIAGETVVCDREYVWPTNAVDSPRIQRETRVSLDGLRTWLTVYNDQHDSQADTWKRTVRLDNTANKTFVTNTAPAGNYSYQVYQLGMLVEEGAYNAGSPIAKTTYAYDSHNRLFTITDARNNRTTTLRYTNKDQLYTITKPGNDVYTFTYDSLGRPWYVLHNGVTENVKSYDLRNRVLKESGAHYQVGYQYDEYGRCTGITNWGPATQLTSFQFDPLTGRLSQMLYPDKATGAQGTQGYTYKYTAAGRLSTARDPRNITSTIGYTLGLPTSLTHSDGTTGISRQLNRLGLTDTLTFGDQVTAFQYGNLGDVRSETNTAGPLAGFVLERTVDPYYQPASASVHNQSVLAQVTAHYAQGRVSSHSADLGTGSTSLTYGYIPLSSMVSSYITPIGTQSLGYDNRDRLQTLSALAGDAHTYHYNVQGLRDMDTLADGSYWSYSYDPLRQLTRADKHLPTGETDLPSQLAGFTFDGIGNTSSGPDPSNPTFSASYGRNNQNQLTTISHAPYLSLSGEADPDATLNVTGSGPYNPASVTRQGSKFRVNYYLPGSSANAYVYLTNVATLPAIANLPAARATNITTLFRPAGSLETLTYDEAGNLFSDARWNYTWDAYNRLTKMESKPGDPEASKRRLQFSYDAAGRRISRVTSTWANGAYQVVDSRKFVYDGWHLVGELTADNSVIRSYAWAGDRLLAIRQGNTIYIPVLDGNGNVMALVNQATRAVEAQYEYGPFGLLLQATGPMALQNPIRYSSEYQDDATGLIYYGYRYLNPATQHWISRDPIGMLGGFNLYGFLDNDPINYRDALGLAYSYYSHDIRNGIPGPYSYMKSEGFGKDTWYELAGMPFVNSLATVGNVAYGAMQGLGAFLSPITQPVAQVSGDFLGAVEESYTGRPSMIGKPLGEFVGPMVLFEGLGAGLKVVQCGAPNPVAPKGPGWLLAGTASAAKNRIGILADQVGAVGNVSPREISIRNLMRRLSGTAKDAEWAKATQSDEFGTGIRDHYYKHGEQVGATSMKEYDLSARLTIQNGKAFRYYDPTTLEPRIGYWDPQTGLFTATTETCRDATINTHFPLTWDEIERLPGFSSLRR